MICGENNHGKKIKTTLDTDDYNLCRHCAWSWEFCKRLFYKEKEIAKFSEGYMNDILKQSVWDIKSHVDNKIETIEITRRINERNHFDIEELPEICICLEYMEDSIQLICHITI